MLNKIFVCLLTLSLLINLSACSKKEEEIKTGINETYSDLDVDYIYKKSDLENDKQENVYVFTDPNGDVLNTEVKVTLKAKENGILKDVYMLEDVVNTSGDENYEIIDDEIVFENHGSDITYKGSTNKDLPVSISIKYYLDDKEIAYSDLAHKSGRLKMVFNYKNNSNLINNVQIPFMCLTFIMLDEDKFSNISLENGKLFNLGDSKIVALYAEPGLKESLKLYTVDTFADVNLNDFAIFEADVTDFTLDYTSTIVTNGIFKEIEDEDINDLYSSINDLSKLNDKIDEIKDATFKLKDEGNKLVDGIGKLNDSAKSLDNAASAFNTNISQIGTLTSSLNTLATSINGIVTNDTLLGVKNAVETTSMILDDMESYCNTLILLKTNIDDIDLNDLEVLDDNKTKAAIINIKNSDLSNISLDTLNKLKTDIESLKTQIDSEEFVGEYSLLIESSNSLALACEAIDSDKTKKQLIDGASSLASASLAFKELTTSLNDNMPDLKKAINEFSDKIDEAIDDNRNDLNKYSSSNMKNIIANIKNLKKLDEDYDSFIGKIDGTSSSVIFTIETGEIK